MSFAATTTTSAVARRTFSLSRNQLAVRPFASVAAAGSSTYRHHSFLPGNCYPSWSRQNQNQNQLHHQHDSLLTAAAASAAVMSFSKSTMLRNLTVTRSFASSSSTTTIIDVSKRLDEFQELFVEARYCIEDVTESVGTTYFEEDAELAKQAVDEAVKAFETLIQDLSDNVEEQTKILRSNGLKVEQLKGELQVALDAAGDHH